MSDERLNDALRLVANAVRDVPDVSDDVARGVAARRRVGLRRVRVGVALTAVAVVGGVAVTKGLSTSGSTTPPAQIHLVSTQVKTPAYTFGLTPQGWSVQGQNPYAVVIAPDNGTTSHSIDDFEGKLVVLFDRNPVSGSRTTSDGRSYWIHSDDAYVTISTRTLPDEPAGVLSVQYPDDAGWSRATMLAFLRSVQVHPGARPGRG